MTGWAAAVAAHLGLLAAGFGVLRAVGAVRPLSLRGLAATGLAYLVGVAAVLQLCVLLLVLGVPFGLPTVAALVGVLSLPLLLELRGLPARLRAARGGAGRLRAAARAARWETWAAAAALAAFAIFAGFSLWGSEGRPIDGYDAWNIWSRKANLMFFGDQLPLAWFTSSPYLPAHPDYPIVLPLFEALHLRALGRWDPSAVHAVFWPLTLAFVGAAAYLASRTTRPLVWGVMAPGIGLLANGAIVTAYADVPVAMFLGLGVLALGLWIEGGRRADLAVAALLLAGAAGIKNEGLIGAVLALAVASVVVAVRRRARLRDLVVAAGLVVALAIAPWRLWLATNGIEGDLPLLRGIDPGYLLSRTERIWPALQGMQPYIASRTTVGLTIAVALAMVVLALRLPDRRLVAAFYLAVGGGYYASLVWAYWISPLPIDDHVPASAERVVTSLAFIALAAVLHLAGSRPVPTAK